MELRAQGATEYLVLLAVVLIIALVGIALLGFFPGTASDAQVSESRIYWQSASPIAIVEWDAKAYSDGTMPYIRLRNMGVEKITITKIISGNTVILLTDFWRNVDLSSGEEMIFGYTTAQYPQTGIPGLPNTIGFWFRPNPAGGSNQLGGFTSQCSSSSPYGYLVLPSFGFEYIRYVEGQQIIKSQMGTRPLVIKCTGPNF